MLPIDVIVDHQREEVKHIRQALLLEREIYYMKGIVRRANSNSSVRKPMVTEYSW
jgi:hypothetical protein